MTTATLVARAHPFSQRPEICQVSAGRTLARMLDEIADGAKLASTLRVEVGGLEVPRQHWDRVKPKAGTQITVTVMPAGGGDSSKWIRAVLMIVVMVVAFYAAPALVGAMGATGAAATALTGLVAAGLNMLGPIVGTPLTPARGL